MLRSFSVLALEERESKMACGALVRRWQGLSDYLEVKGKRPAREPAGSVLVGAGSSGTLPAQNLGTKFLPGDFPMAGLPL